MEHQLSLFGNLPVIPGLDAQGNKNGVIDPHPTSIRRMFCGCACLVSPHLGRYIVIDHDLAIALWQVNCEREIEFIMAIVEPEPVRVDGVRMVPLCRGGI